MRLLILLVFFTVTGCYSTRKATWEKYKGKEKALNAYLSTQKLDPLEGIYSVSDQYNFKSLVFRRPKTKSKEHYAQVVIIKSENLTRDFIEVNLDQKMYKRYVVLADIQKVSKEDLYLFKQYKISRAYRTISFTNDRDIGVMISEPFKKKGFRAMKITRSLIKVSSID